MNPPLTIVGIPGSLRKGSFNRMALTAAQRLAPEGVTIEIFEIAGIPLFNQDEEKQPPPRVVELKKRVRAADAVIFATPEYNYSFPGVLKNAIDWASRPYGDNAWQEKPVAVMGASPSVLGTARAQYQLRQCFIFLNMYPLNLPEVMISKANERFNAEGEITDDASKELIRKLIDGLAKWTLRLRQNEASAKPTLKQAS